MGCQRFPKLFPDLVPIVCSVTMEDGGANLKYAQPLWTSVVSGTIGGAVAVRSRVASECADTATPGDRRPPLRQHQGSAADREKGAVSSQRVVDARRDGRRLFESLLAGVSAPSGGGVEPL